MTKNQTGGITVGYLKTYSCPVCCELRLAWYATATPLSVPDYEVIARDRRKPAYRAALARLREHRRECDGMD